MNRSNAIEAMESLKKEFDFIIIGGGATGSGILLEAATRGYSAVLLEASDFTKSTSSKSTKLVHGGVRYLKQGDIGLVREACIERGRLRRNAPHIVKNQSFIIPVFSRLDEIKYLLGLKLYDLLSGKYSMGRSVRLNRRKVSSCLSNLKESNLKAGIRYKDGQFDDSRLAFSVLRTACLKGGRALNYFPVTALLKDRNGILNAVKASDSLTGKEYTLKGRFIINATGVFADEISKLDEPGKERSIRPSQGVHIVVSKDFLPGKHALMIPETEDGRVLFAVPWLNHVILGTTDTPIEEASLEPAAKKEEIDFILRTAASYLKKAPEPEDILSVFTGLRPLAANSDSSKTKEISRSHKIIVSNSGLFTIIGGKWTTFRKMAEDLVNRVEKEKSLSPTRSKSSGTRLFGYQRKISRRDPLYLYGTEADKIRSLQKREEYKQMISSKLKITAAQVVYSVREEMAMTVEDVLARRTRALLLDAREAKEMAEPVAKIMAKELGRSSEWIQKEVSKFLKLADNYIPV